MYTDNDGIATQHSNSLVFPFHIHSGNEIIPPKVIHSPRYLWTSLLSSTSFQLNWVNANEEVEHYNIYCYYRSCPYCSHLPRVERLQTIATYATVSGLLPFTEYTCCVTASTLYGESTCSEEINILTQPCEKLSIFYPKTFQAT